MRETIITELIRTNNLYEHIHERLTRRRLVEKTSNQHSLGDRLRQAREGIPLSVRELHAKSGIAVSTIFYIETNQKTPQQRTLRRLAEALGIDPTSLAPLRHTG